MKSVPDNIEASQYDSQRKADICFERYKLTRGLSKTCVWFAVYDDGGDMIRCSMTSFVGGVVTVQKRVSRLVACRALQAR